MKCGWCSGTGNRGDAKKVIECEHCENGEVADPPFGQQVDNVLPEEAVEAFASYWCNPLREETLGEFIQRVAQYAHNLKK